MSVSKRRVVVTGLGLVTPLGLGVKENWLNLLLGKSSTISLESDSMKNKISIILTILISQLKKLTLNKKRFLQNV